ncbi:exodeoxyribonuclease V subunit gamma [bacterium]|nr:exodeoxyribonuclease V subunit gamma [bacterium]
MKEGTEFHEIYLYKSNSLAAFLHEASEIIEETSKANPFVRKIVVVQNDAVGRWLALNAAEEKGVAANIKFFSPDDFLRNFAEKYLGIETKNSVFNKKNTEWALYSIFNSDFLERPEFLPVKNYIKNDEGRKFRLCRKIADLFEQYIVYRPHIIENWKKGRLCSDNSDEIWQKEIFMELAKTDPHSEPDFARLFIKKCSEAKLDGFRFNPLILFGISQMNTYHLNMFYHLSKLFPVHIFAVQPSIEYVYKEEKETFFRRFCSSAIEITDFFAENPPFKETELFIKPLAPTLLASVQRDILDDEDDEKKDGGAYPDGSLRISACCGKMREMEVLKDSLLELFKNDRNLFPENIAVLCPDLKSYEPYINAVFRNTPQNDNTFIPFAIGEAGAAEEAKISQIFLKILKLGKEFYKKSDILSIFKEPSVCGKFGTNREDFPKIEKILEESGIKWGRDTGFMKKEYNLSGRNTWEFGLDRIMMSSFMPFSENGESFSNILPLENFNEERATLLEGFITFIRELFRLSDKISEPETPSEFKYLLEKALDTFFIRDRNTAEEIRRIKNILGNFAETAGNYPGKIPFNALLIYLEDEFSRTVFRKNSVGSKVNFASLKEMHSIPFKVVCLIGMDEELFPRKDTEYAFDLTRKINAESGEPKIRSLRENDFHLFLDAVISAGEKLIISYDARELREDSKKHRSPAMPVKILEKHISKKTEKPLNEIETKYPALSFSADYFTEEGRFTTFSMSDFRVAEKMFHVEHTPANPVAIRVSDEKEEISEHFTLPLDNLLSFFKDPQKEYFKTLKVTLPNEEKTCDDEEIFDYDNWLQNFNLRQTYLKMSAGLPDEESVDENFIRRMKGEGKIPAGAIGEEKLKNIVKDSKVREFAEKLYSEDLLWSDFSFDLETAGATINGRTENIRLKNGEENVQSNRAIIVVLSSFDTKYKILSIIRHFAMNAAGIRLDTHVYALNSKEIRQYILEQTDVKTAKERLSVFVELWKKGRKSMPLYNGKILEIMGKAAKTVNFNLESAIEEAGKDKFVSPYFLLMREQFKLQKERFLAEFPTDEIQAVINFTKLLKNEKLPNKQRNR